MGWEEDSSTPIDEFCFATASWHSREAIFAYSEVKGGKRSQFSKLLRLDELAWTDFLSGARRGAGGCRCRHRASSWSVPPACLAGLREQVTHVTHTTIDDKHSTLARPRSELDVAQPANTVKIYCLATVSIDETTIPLLGAKLTPSAHCLALYFCSC